MRILQIMTSKANGGAETYACDVITTLQAQADQRSGQHHSHTRGKSFPHGCVTVNRISASCSPFEFTNTGVRQNSPR